jgi:CBS domain-containing protein
MSRPASTPHSAKEMIDALKTARDQAKVQAHLLSLDAKKRWHAVEAGLLELETKLERSGERLTEGLTASFREVSQAARDLLRELDGTLELAIPVKRLMQTPVTCSPDDSLNHAAQLMWDRDCGAVPVVGSDGAVVGIITDRDICMATYTRGQAPGAISVESVMSKAVQTCSPEDSVGDAARLMAEKRVRRLPVTIDGRLVGLLALADIAREIRTHQGNPIPACVALAHTLAAISQPRAADRAQAAE